MFGFYHTESTTNGSYFGSYLFYRPEVKSELLFRHLVGLLGMESSLLQDIHVTGQHKNRKTCVLLRLAFEPSTSVFEHSETVIFFIPYASEIGIEEMCAVIS